MQIEDLKKLLEQQGEAFEAFKNVVSTEMRNKLTAADPVFQERLAKIEKSLDTAIEGKAKFEAGLAAEQKEREELEAKFNRMGISKDGDAGKRELEIKTHNIVLGAAAGEKNERFTPLDEKGYDQFKELGVRYMRKGASILSHEEVKTLFVGSDPDGGYFVTPDVGGRIVTKAYETSPIRQIASAQVISTDALEGIEDLGEAGAGYAGETAQGSDTTTPQVGKWRIPVFWIDTEPKTTQQLLDDAAVDIEAWLSGKVGDKFGRFENNEFVNGAAAKIRGFASYTMADESSSPASWGSLGFIKSGASADFAASTPADQLFDLIGLLKEVYLPNARWVTRRSVITKIRKFKESTTNGYIWQPGLQAGVPEMLLGYPVTRAEDVPAIAANSFSLWFGDFRTAYQIVDRQGIRVLRDNLTSKPYVKFYTTKRTGGGVVNFEAIKAMKFIN